MKNMEVKLNVKKVTILLSSGTDIVNITLSENSSFPVLGYETVLKVECQQGFGKEWCRKTLGVDAEIIKIPSETRVGIHGGHLAS